VRIVSLNAWGGALFGELAAWLPGVGADVLCLQETTHTAGLTGWTTFSDDVRSLPQRANLFADVAELLPRYRATFDASDAGPVLAQDGRRHRQEFGLGLFVDERIAALDSSNAFVHGRFADHEVWPVDDRPRIAQAVRLGRGSDAPVTVVHVHGLRTGLGKQDTPARLEQAHRLGSFVAATRKPGDLTVLCGDLNLLPSSETFDILAGFGLTDLVRYADTRTSRYAKPTRHASYLLVSDPAAVVGFEVLEAPEVSDHRALVLDL
jgi:endonuclease/exonuclease/phosphatase family metal-dependent hydrolase